jgi:Fis family transcriptional regulator
MVISSVEKPLIEMVLKHAGGNQTRAAELLGINRNTLRSKMKQYQIK